MAQKKISDLTLRSGFSDACQLPVDDSTQTWRVTGAQINSNVNTSQGTTRAGLYGGTSGGSANAQTLTPTVPLTSQVAGTSIDFVAGYTNSGATTIAISGLTAKNIKTAYGDALTGGEIVAGQVYSLLYDGTQYIINGGDGNAALRTVRGNSTTAAAKRADLAVSSLKTLLFIPDSVQRLETTGSGTYYTEYAFVISATVTTAPTAGATYTHNSVTWTVLRTITIGSITFVYAWGNGAPTATGTLTKSAGTGDASIVFIEAHFPKRLHGEAVGSGGGGKGSGANGAAGAAGDGASTLFGSSLITCPGGGQATGNTVGGAGGAAPTVASPAIQIFAAAGQYGGGGGYNGSSTAGSVGGGGASSPLGGGSPGTGVNAAAIAGIANTGAGGAGGSYTDGTTTRFGGGGGGSGSYAKFLIPNPAASYGYTIPAGGTAGSAGAGGNAGAAGANGFVGIRAEF